MKKSIFLILCLLCSVGAMAQKTVSGVVTDAMGEAVIGASVIETGAAGNGTVTDLDGKFSLTVDPNGKIQVSDTRPRP